MKKIFSCMALTAVALLAFFCTKREVPAPDSGEQAGRTAVATRAIGDKTPGLIVYVETNDVNPANAADWELGGNQLIDIVNLFAANIHKGTGSNLGEPVLYLNDKLAPVLGDTTTYIKPLKDAGIKVLLTILGDHQGIGVANMTATQQEQFVNELLYAYYRYDLDGIDFDDEYADYPVFPTVPGTPYANIITLLRAKLPADALITVFDWGYTNYINSGALNAINYATHGFFETFVINTSSNIPNMPKSKWSPFSWNLGAYTTADLSEIERQAARTKRDCYPLMMFFNLRTRADHDPMNAFQATVDGAWSGQTVTCSNGNRPRAAAIPGGTPIPHDTAAVWLSSHGKPYYNSI